MDAQKQMLDELIVNAIGLKAKYSVQYLDPSKWTRPVLLTEKEAEKIGDSGFKIMIVIELL